MSTFADLGELQNPIGIHRYARVAVTDHHLLAAKMDGG